MNPIDAFLKKTGRNKIWLAEQLNVTHSAVSKHASGQTVPRHETMEKYGELSNGAITAADFHALHSEYLTKARASP